MNNLSIVGRLTKDPESRTTQTGKQVVSFTVAVARRNDREKSDYFRVSAWGELGSLCKVYLAKGKMVGVTGSVSASAYKGQDGAPKASLEVTASEVEFLTPKSESPQEAPQRPAIKEEFVQVEEELPF